LCSRINHWKLQLMTDTYLYGANIFANKIRQHYLRYGGAGAPLILIPGITSPAATWGFVARRLGQSFDTYVLDVRGRGLSETGPTLDYSLDAYAKDVAEFAAALDLEHVVLVGHSMGARIAIRAGRQYGARFERLLLIDPPVSGPGRRPYPKALPGYLEAIRAAKRGVSVEAVRAAYPTWNDEQLRLRAEWLHTCDETAVSETHRGFQEEDIHGDLPKIDLPMQLVVAGKGGVITESDVTEIKQLAPSIAITRIPQASHMIPWDEFEAFFLAIDGFLANRR
jgi:N-formylmaleamate deformylase